jgi:hypothetical protein
MSERMGGLLIAAGALLFPVAATYPAAIIVLACISGPVMLGYLIAAAITGITLAWWGFLIAMLPELCGGS